MCHYCVFVCHYVCVCVCVVVVVTPPHRQPHAVFGGLISISGGWLLLCNELIIMVEDSSSTTFQRITTFYTLPAEERIIKQKQSSA